MVSKLLANNNTLTLCLIVSKGLKKRVNGNSHINQQYTYKFTLGTRVASMCIVGTVTIAVQIKVSAAEGSWNSRFSLATNS